MTFYGYNKCSTCRKAKALLQKLGVEFTEIDITARPPAIAELKAVLAAGCYSVSSLFNRSGQAYRDLHLKDKLPQMSAPEALQLLAGNGRLVKRPFIVDGARVVVGFDEPRIREYWG